MNVGADQLRVLETVFLQDVLPTFIAAVFLTVLAAIAFWKLAASAVRTLGDLVVWVLRKTGVEARLERWERLIDLRNLRMEQRIREASRAD